MISYIRKSFKRELLAGFLLAGVLPLIFAMGFLIELFKVKLQGEDVRLGKAQAEAVEETLKIRFDDFRRMSELLATDRTMVSAMKSRESLDYSGVYTQLYKVTEGLREEAQFDIYADTGECLSSTGAGVIHEKLSVYWGILREALAHPGELALQREGGAGRGKDVALRAARTILDEEDRAVGYVVVSLRVEHFEKILEGLLESEEGLLILDKFWAPVYESGTAQKSELARTLRYRRVMGEPLDLGYGNNNVYITEIGDTELTSVCLRPRTLGEETVKTMYQVMLIMVFVSMGICLMVAFVMSKNLTQPVLLLKDAMQKVQEGNLDTRIETGREDEFGLLAGHFNTMTVELAGHMERQVSQQRQLDETSIAMMQSQLNPHFLYNTLDTMKWMAKTRGMKELAMIATKLAKILRTSISGEQFITLKEELALVEGYVQIQRLRFAGNFQYEERVSEELRECMVPKLTLQPLVENALLHGLEGRRDGSIQVTGYRKGKDLWLEVRDDGCGICPELLKELKKGKKERPQGHIGFYNVDTILKLNYGEEYGLTVSLPVEGGTRVSMRLPAVVWREAENGNLHGGAGGKRG